MAVLLVMVVVVAVLCVSDGVCGDGGGRVTGCGVCGGYIIDGGGSGGGGGGERSPPGIFQYWRLCEYIYPAFRGGLSLCKSLSLSVATQYLNCLKIIFSFLKRSNNYIITEGT